MSSTEGKPTPETTIDERFSRAIELRDEGKYNDSLLELLSLIKEYPNDKRIFAAHLVAGGIYDDLNDAASAMFYFSKATKLRPQSEMASLGLYLAYVGLDEAGMAIQEMKRYLDRYPADLYKTTLEELLGDLKDGYATNFEGTILMLAKKHGVMA